MRKLLTEIEGEDLWPVRREQDYRDITNNVLENMSEPEISLRMKAAGIRGIKYLDGDSRRKGKGSYNYVIFDDKDIQITEQLFMPTEVQEGSPASLFRRRSKRDGMMGRYFKNSVYLKDGSRISGVSENDIQDPLLGYDKNNQPFTIRRESL